MKQHTLVNGVLKPQGKKYTLAVADWKLLCKVLLSHQEIEGQFMREMNLVKHLVLIEVIWNISKMLNGGVSDLDVKSKVFRPCEAETVKQALGFAKEIIGVFVDSYSERLRMKSIFKQFKVDTDGEVSN